MFLVKGFVVFVKIERDPISKSVDYVSKKKIVWNIKVILEGEKAKNKKKTRKNK